MEGPAEARREPPRSTDVALLTALPAETLQAIRHRWACATPGPWAWFGNTDSHNVYLATTRWGRHYVMGFRRWGMQRAQPTFRQPIATGPVQWEEGRPRLSGEIVTVPEVAVYERTYRKDLLALNTPDAMAIAHAPEDVRLLLAEVDRLRGLLAEARLPAPS